jgi:serine-type D-Ala-D-Ala carboxypeptidase/endopeptidase (penicillin-binding protein 4)
LPGHVAGDNEPVRASTTARRSVVAALAAVVTVVGLVPAPPAGAEGQASTASPAGRTPLPKLLEKRLSDPRLGRNVAMIVVDAATGTVLEAHRAGHTMTAASNMKIVTGVNALATLGATRRFRTTVLAGAAHGSVILQGAGDPLLAGRDLDALAARTAKHLPRHATVVVHVDGDLFPRPSNAPGWVPAAIGNSIGRVQALAVRGDRSRHPSLNAAERFAAGLRSHGLKATVGGNEDAAADAPVLAKAKGHTVAASVGVMLSVSESGVAETLFRHVAIARGIHPSWAGSQRAAKQSLQELGIDTTGLVLADGSGLSRDDRISPRFLAAVLRVARVTQKPRFRALFKTSAMPVAGRSGTLDTSFGRYTTSPSRCARGDVQAKTGTIPGTVALSGVAKPSKAGERIFSIVVNNRPLRYDVLDSRRALDGLAATVEGCWH